MWCKMMNSILQNIGIFFVERIRLYNSICSNYWLVNIGNTPCNKQLKYEKKAVSHAWMYLFVATIEPFPFATLVI